MARAGVIGQVLIAYEMIRGPCPPNGTERQRQAAQRRIVFQQLFYEMALMLPLTLVLLGGSKTNLLNLLFTFVLTMVAWGSRIRDFVQLARLSDVSPPVNAVPLCSRFASPVLLLGVAGLCLARCLQQIETHACVVGNEVDDARVSFHVPLCPCRISFAFGAKRVDAHHALHFSPGYRSGSGHRVHVVGVYAIGGPIFLFLLDRHVHIACARTHARAVAFLGNPHF